MRFKFLHVMPHVWFYKQKETLGKSTCDDNSSEPAFVYKRSTSLRLVRSGSSSAESLKGNPSEGKPKSNTSVQGRLSNETLQKQDKEIRICTVVDAGCTCRATMTSQHKQKKEAGGYTDARGDGSGGHGRRLPRRLDCVSKSGSSASTSRNNMVSRLVCKSIHDVVKQSTEAHEVKHYNAVYVGEEAAAMGTQKAWLDVDELECRLRNAGLEERGRKKKNRNYEECLTNTSVSDSVATNTNIVNTATSSEVQEGLGGLVTSEINFDGIESSSMGNNMITLAGLRASLAQRKLGKHRLINQASHHGGEQQLIDRISDRLVSNEQLSIDGQKVNAMAPSLPIQEFVEEYVASAAKVESVKHVDVGINKDYLKAPFDNYGLNQPKACNDQPKLKLLYEEETPSSALIRRPRKLKSNPNHVISKEKAYELAGPEHGRRIVSNTASAQFAPNQGGIERQLEPNQRGVQPHGEVINGAGSRLGGDYHDDGDEEKQVVSSSSCEIQVPSDHYENHDDDDGMLSMMVSGSWLSSAGAAAGDLHHGLMSSGAVAMVKNSYDPHHDFKESMVEMVVAKQLRGPRQLHQLLQCYLSLNPEEYHAIIIKVFHDLCSDLLH